MPFKDTDDAHNRFKSAAQPPRRPGYISDIHAAKGRSFPNVGTTLPLRRTFAQSARPVPGQRVPQPVPKQSYQPPDTPVQPTPHYPPQPQPQPRPVKKPKRRRRLFTKKRIALLFVLAILLAGGWVGVKFFYNVQKVFHGNIFNVLTTTKLDGEDTGRVNILLAGNSADDPGHNGANLTDSIMVVSIDVKDNSAFMLSVPRDLWVDIPGYHHAKINEAYVAGEDDNFSAPGYPNGGMGLLEEVIQQNFGIKANYYALVNYNALRDAVNAVGGIDVNIQSSDPRGLYDPSIDWTTHGPLVKLANGAQHLSGEQALDLARARGDAYGSYGFPESDFDRTEHQRQMILAVKSKVISAGVLANPLALSNLFDSIGQNVKTDLTLSEVRRLYDIGKDINNNSVQSVSLNDANGANLLSNYTSPTNQSALIPSAGLDNFSKIQTYIARLMASNAVTRENASVVMLNGTNVYGLAAQKEKTLSAKGVNVTSIGDAQSIAASTTIIDASAGAKPATLALLKSLYGANVTTTNPYSNVYDADFIIVLGPDQVPATTPSTPQ